MKKTYLVVRHPVYHKTVLSVTEIDKRKSPKLDYPPKALICNEWRL